MTRFTCLPILLTLLSTAAFADPAGQAQLEAILRDPARSGTPPLLMRSLGEQDLSADRSEIFRALTLANAPTHARLLLAVSNQVESRSGSVSVDRILFTNLQDGGRILRVGTQLQYQVQGGRLVNILGLEVGTKLTNLAPVSYLDVFAPAVGGPSPLTPVTGPSRPGLTPVTGPSAPGPMTPGASRPLTPVTGPGASQPLTPVTGPGAARPLTPTAGPMAGPGASQPMTPVTGPSVAASVQPATSGTTAAGITAAPTPAGPPPSIGAAGALSQALSLGSRGSEVSDLQARLNLHRAPGSEAIATDSIFGAKTEAALRDFQTRRGLPVTGQLDAATEAALAKPPGLQRGERGPDVRRLQQLLNAERASRGLPALATDGVFGGDTEAALKDFQTRQGMPATGLADDASYRALETAQPRSPYASPRLERGHTGDSVTALQYLLNNHRDAAGLPVIGQDGDFGSSTERALTRFQRERGLPATGVADPATWAKLRETPSASAPSARPLARGDRGDEVKTLQSRINRHREAAGQPTIAVDGAFGPATSDAIGAFQREKNLPVTGALDAPTLAALNAAPTYTAPPTQPVSTPTTPPSSSGALRGLKVAIDSGHGVTASGAFDPGAVNRSTGVTEYELNRRVSSRVKALLEARGAAVTLQQYPRGAPRRSLYNKGALVARGHHLFLSVHHNAANRDAQGSLVLVHQTRATQSSIKLAEAISSQLNAQLWNGARNRDRGVKRQGLSVLRGAHSQVNTAVLVEGFFLDPANVTEAVASQWIEREASAIADGVANYWRTR